MNNIENNKLIAEFMQHEWDMEVNNDLCILDNSFEKVKRKLHYSDWNELMSVVDKIEEIGHGVTIYRKGCHINDIALTSVNGFNHSSKIEQTYKAVVEFIKWYNSAKENTTDRLSNRDLGQSTII